ncbi:hypothetical protein MJ561_09850 [Klebsiella pneumoniae]|nr:hypothetical protein MJ561_09850 [Klebsiella pneumoniae]
MVHDAGRRRHADPVEHLSYLDEAEQCRDVLLMNEGNHLPVRADGAGRKPWPGAAFCLQPAGENNRRLLQRALKLPQVSDGVIQGNRCV